MANSKPQRAAKQEAQEAKAATKRALALAVGQPETVVAPVEDQQGLGAAAAADHGDNTGLTDRVAAIVSAAGGVAAAVKDLRERVIFGPGSFAAQLVEQVYATPEALVTDLMTQAAARLHEVYGRGFGVQTLGDLRSLRTQVLWHVAYDAGKDPRDPEVIRAANLDASPEALAAQRAAYETLIARVEGADERMQDAATPGGLAAAWNLIRAAMNAEDAAREAAEAEAKAKAELSAAEADMEIATEAEKPAAIAAVTQQEQVVQAAATEAKAKATKAEAAKAKVTKAPSPKSGAATKEPATPAATATKPSTTKPGASTPLPATDKATPDLRRQAVMVRAGGAGDVLLSEAEAAVDRLANAVVDGDDEDAEALARDARLSMQRLRTLRTLTEPMADKDWTPGLASDARDLMARLSEGALAPMTRDFRETLSALLAQAQREGGDLRKAA